MTKLCKECRTPVEGGWSMCPPCTDAHDRMTKLRDRVQVCRECYAPKADAELLGGRCYTCANEYAHRGTAINLIDPDTGHTMMVPGRIYAKEPTATGTEAEVCKDIAERQQGGITKYNTTVRENPLSLRQWLQHAYEECLDQAVYLKRAMEEIDRG